MVASPSPMPEPIVNARDIAALKRRDKLFSRIAKLYGDPPNWRRRPGFVSLCHIILEQQVSIDSAKAHFATLRSYVPSFTPAAILGLSDGEMRRCQISRQKASYLRALSLAVVEGRLSFRELGRQGLSLTREQLLAVKGIGPWTVDIYSMFCLQAKDIFPLGDIAVMSAAVELHPGSAKGDIEALSERWKPYRSLAAYYLWHYYLCERGRSA
jgi:DNA-3-methyladenine glycosylase II